MFRELRDDGYLYVPFKKKRKEIKGYLYVSFEDPETAGLAT